MVMHSRQQQEGGQERIQYLESEIAALNNMIKVNNQDFQEEIQVLMGVVRIITIIFIR